MMLDMSIGKRFLGDLEFEGDTADLLKSLRELDSENAKLKLSNASLTAMLAESLQRIIALEKKQATEENKAEDTKKGPLMEETKETEEEEAEIVENEENQSENDDDKDLLPLFFLMWTVMFLFYILFL